jgi:hypothetical protein
VGLGPVGFLDRMVDLIEPWCLWVKTWYVRPSGWFSSVCYFDWVKSTWSIKKTWSNVTHGLRIDLASTYVD